MGAASTGRRAGEELADDALEDEAVEAATATTTAELVKGCKA
jgi:hypothetical protein